MWDFFLFTLWLSTFHSYLDFLIQSSINMKAFSMFFDFAFKFALILVATIGEHFKLPQHKAATLKALCMFIFPLPRPLTLSCPQNYLRFNGRGCCRGKWNYKLRERHRERETKREIRRKRERERGYTEGGGGCLREREEVGDSSPLHAVM